VVGDAVTGAAASALVGRRRLAQIRSARRLDGDRSPPADDPVTPAP